MAKAKIIRKDRVMITAGKEKGKTGEVLAINRKKDQLIVSGLNLAKKAIKPSKKTPQGGIIEVAKPVPISKVAYLCAHCGKPTRIGIKPGSKKTTERYCKKCQAAVKE